MLRVLPGIVKDLRAMSVLSAETSTLGANCPYHEIISGQAMKEVPISYVQ